MFLYMNTEDFTSFFKLINNLNIENQQGGNPFLESIETKKFSMVGAAEKPNTPAGPVEPEPEKEVSNAAVFKQLAELLQKLKIRFDNDVKERDDLMRSSETSSATIEQKDKTLAEKTEELEKLKELLANQGDYESVKLAKEEKDKEFEKLKREENIHLEQIKKLEQMVTTFGDDAAKLEKELTDITDVLTASHTQVKKEVSDVDPVKQKLIEAQATLKTLKTDYEKAKEALNKPKEEGAVANPNQKGLDDSKAVAAGNTPGPGNIVTNKKPDPFKPATTNTDLVKDAAAGIVQGTGLGALQGGSEIDDLLNFTEVNSEKSSNNITDILSNLL